MFHCKYSFTKIDRVTYFFFILIPDVFFLQKFSKLLKYKPKLPDSSWELVEQPTDNDAKCDCKRSTKSKVTS